VGALRCGRRASLRVAANGLVGARAAVFDAGEDFGEWVLDDRDAQAEDFLESAVAAGDEGFLLADETRVERAFVEGAGDGDRWLEVVGRDVLGQRGVAADVAFLSGVEHLGIELADDVAEVEIAIGKLGHVLAADVAEIAFVAFGHGSRRR
jgi:hypothetical protein